MPNAGFEDGTLTGWSTGSQTGTLGPSINGNGTGVTVFSGSRLFSHGARSAMGNPTINKPIPNTSPQQYETVDNPYYAPAVAAGTWTFSPKNATYAVLLQPKGEQTFAQASTALGLSGTQTSAITSMLSSQAQASGFGSGTPTDAAWITREVELTAGVTYTMAWNYMATDYVPFNDGSITSLVPVTVASTPVITVNNFEQSYALLGFSNPGTGDYSTNSYGSTGWQMSTYEVSVTGTYKLGFTVFNLDDTALSPVLMVDSEIGTTLSCDQAGGSCETFGGVEPNNETAPTLPPTTTTEPPPSTTTTTTEPPPTTTTTTLPPATSLEVTSLDDTTSAGTLRWAITQANAQSGGIYDSITFASGLEGTITLTSDLPAITQSVSITGTGIAQTIIDGNNLYRAIYNNGQRSITISDMTFKQGKNTTGGIVWTNQGTLTVTNVKFTASQGYAWYQQNGTVTSFNNCQFTYLSGGISSDHGSTPSAKSFNDGDYTNRVYINNSLFTNNGTAVGTERFVKVNNSTFANNGVALQLQGLNRQQVLNSTFTDNSSAVYMFSWMPTQWAYGTDNQLVEGNTFTRNTSAINFNNYFNDGAKTYNNTGANSWSTARNNTFDDNIADVVGGYGITEDNNTVVTTTTTTTTTTTSTTTTTTTTTVPEVPTGTTTTTEPAIVPPPVETIPTENTTVSIPELDPTPVSTPEIDTTPVVIPEPEDLPNETIPEVSIPEETQNTADETITDIFNNADNPDELGAAVTDAIDNADSPEEVAALVTSLLDGPLNNEEFAAVVDSVFADDLSTEELSAALDAVFSELLSDEKFAEVIDAVLDSPLTDEQFAEVVDILESDTVSEEQVADAVDSILENGVTADQATDLATSEKVLESIDGDQAAEIFDEIPVGELTTEEEAALVEAVTNAPEEIKNAFEETINVYAEGLDDYVPVGSNVDVGSRRTLLAASAALTAATAGVVGSGGGSGGSGGGSGGSGGGSGGSGGGSGGNSNGRKEEENPDGEEEEDAEIEGPEDPEDNNFTRNSIFKYEEGTMKRRFSPWGFIKKLGRETSALAFTISGSVVVFATLSGETRTITIIATSCAFVVHYIHAMIKNDED
jgi:hypothetical protein